MLDTVRPGDPPARIADTLAGSRRRRLTMRLDYHLGGLLHHSPREAYKYVVNLIRWRQSGPEGQVAAAMKAENPTLANVIRVNRTALFSYVPRPYPGNVVMLLSSDEPDRVLYDPRLAWADLMGGGLTVRWIPGNHENILDEPQVGGVATVLAQCLR
jgi:thioesterase domain-containing protein